MISPIQGFREVEHTSDIALEVWAASMESLFLEGAIGLYTLMGMKTRRGSIAIHHKEIHGMDKESLLVSFLEDLLFLVEHENYWCDVKQLSVSNLSIFYSGNILQIQSLKKPIKAVTFHDLKIMFIKNCWKTCIVFDV